MTSTAIWARSTSLTCCSVPSMSDRTREFLDHLSRVANLLAPGGLYLLDSFVWFRIFHDYKRSWTRRRGPVTVRTRYRAEITDPIKQTYDECLTFAVNDNGKQTVISGRVPAKVFFPQEFLCLLELSGRFEFIGWYNDFSLTAELKAEGRHLAVLRKRWQSARVSEFPPSGNSRLCQLNDR